MHHKAFNKHTRKKYWGDNQACKEDKMARRKVWGDNQACKEGDMVGHFASPSKQARRVWGDNQACKEGRNGGPFHLTKHSISIQARRIGVTTKHARRGEMVGHFPSPSK